MVIGHPKTGNHTYLQKHQPRAWLTKQKHLDRPGAARPSGEAPAAEGICPPNNKAAEIPPRVLPTPLETQDFNMIVSLQLDGK